MGMNDSIVFGPLGKWFLIFDYTGNGSRAVFPMAEGPGDQGRPIQGHEAGAWKGKPRSLIPETIGRARVGANFSGIGHLHNKNPIRSRKRSEIPDESEPCPNGLQEE